MQRLSETHADLFFEDLTLLDWCSCNISKIVAKNCCFASLRKCCIGLRLRIFSAKHLRLWKISHKKGIKNMIKFKRLFLIFNQLFFLQFYGYIGGGYFRVVFYCLLGRREGAQRGISFKYKFFFYCLLQKLKSH